MDKAFTVSLCNPDKDVYVTLAVPAEPWAVLDAWERLRPAPDTRVESVSYTHLTLPTNSLV